MDPLQGGGPILGFQRRSDQPFRRVIHAILERLGVESSPQAVQEALPRPRPTSRNHVFPMKDAEIDQCGNLPGGMANLKRFEVHMVGP